MPTNSEQTATGAASVNPAAAAPAIQGLAVRWGKKREGNKQRGRNRKDANLDGGIDSASWCILYVLHKDKPKPNQPSKVNKTHNPDHGSCFYSLPGICFAAANSKSSEKLLPARKSGDKALNPIPQALNSRPEIRSPTPATQLINPTNPQP